MLPTNQLKLVQKRLASMQRNFSDKDGAISAVKHLYELIGEGEPEILWLPSPLACAKTRKLYSAANMTKYPRTPRMAKDLKYDLRFSTREARRLELRGIESLAWWRASAQRDILGDTVHRTSLIRSLYLGIAAIATDVPMKDIVRNRLLAWEQVYLRCYFVFLRKGVVGISAHPVIYKTDAEGRLHCSDGPAIAYSDHSKLFFWHGVNVADWLVMRPDVITAHRIQWERNAEIRRVMLERYGMERYLKDCKARLINKSKWGELYEVLYQDATWARFVRVKNSTPEPDGSFKEYVLQVRPDAPTAGHAVAWTFGFRNPKKYKEALEQET